MYSSEVSVLTDDEGLWAMLKQYTFHSTCNIPSMNFISPRLPASLNLGSLPTPTPKGLMTFQNHRGVNKLMKNDDHVEEIVLQVFHGCG
jgi:hypothetical protein